jgi:phosphinothricin acetyltransferase
MSDPRIRPMVPQDWIKVADIYAQGIATGIATFQTEVPHWDVWDAGHRKDARIVAEKDSEVIGFATLSPVSARACYRGVAEVSIYIDESARGMGIGKLLLKQLIILSEEVGIWTLQSSIDRENIASIRLHESCGFRLLGFREKIACDWHGVWRDTVLMERRSQSIGN